MVKVNVQEFLREQDEMDARAVSVESGREVQEAEAAPDEEASSPSEKKSVPRSGRPKREGSGSTSVMVPRELSSRLARIQMYHFEETDEKLSMGAIIGRLLESGLESAFGEKVARKVRRR